MPQEINVQVIGFSAHDGVSNKGQGNPYGFSQLYYLKTSRSFKNANTNIRRCGFEVAELRVTHDPIVEAEFLKMPCTGWVTLILEPDPNDLSKSICIAWKHSDKKVA